MVSSAPLTHYWKQQWPETIDSVLSYVNDPAMNKSYIRSVSLPSLPLNILDVPSPGTEGHIFSAEFVYNKFTADELKNDTGIYEENLGAAALGIQEGDSPIHSSLQTKEGTGGNNSIVNAVDWNAFLPRFVLINTPKALATMSVEMLNETDSSGDIVLPSQKEEEAFEMYVRDNVGDLVEQSYFATTGFNATPYVVFLFQDTRINEHTYNILDVCAQLTQLLTDGSNKIDNPGGYEQALNTLKIELGNEEATVDGADDVAKFIEELYNDMQAKNVKNYFSLKDSSPSGNFMQNWRETGFARVSHHGLINGMHVAQLTKRMASDGFGPFAVSVGTDHGKLRDLQTTARGLNVTKTGGFSAGDFDIILPDLTEASGEKMQGRFGTMEKASSGMFKDGQSPTITPWEIRPRGYFIEKFELIDLVNSSGKAIGKAWDRMQPVVFGSPSHTSGIDAKVKVDAKYLYRPRTIAEIKMQVMHSHGEPWTSTYSGEWITAKILVLSKPGPAVIVDISSSLWDTPPPPPTDLKFVWDYFNNEMTFHWGFPVENQEDIFYFKIFRRSSIFEPFQLQALYDFNYVYSNAQIQHYPYVRPSLVKNLGSYPQTFYIDKEFNKESAYIYTVMAGDAHGNWSNYAEQYVVSFDRIKNKLVMQRISRASAPAPFPNWCLRKDIKTLEGTTALTEDKIAVSGYDQMMIAFEPEARKLTNEVVGDVDTDLGHFVVKEDKTTMDYPYKKGRYVMSVTNLDRHKTELIDLNINAKGYSV